MFFRADCRHFLGHAPCKPHKEHGYHCAECPAYARIGQRILIIKLGAMGDVIRTTPLVSRYRSLDPATRITWITLFPEVLPRDQIDEIVELNAGSVLYVMNVDWDIAINLDKDKEAAALLKTINAREKYGFILENSVVKPANRLADHKFKTGLFDDDSKANTKSYCTEIFELCGLDYRGEPYLLEPLHWDDPWDLPRDKRIVGLNTGCGERWRTRLWSVEKWVELARLLTDAGYQPVLLGGADEHRRNEAIQAASGAVYFGYFPLPGFQAIVDECDLVVTQVTMALHLSLALGKKVVLMNNIFNPNEFDLFGRGTIIAPARACDCFYRPACVHGTSCMETLQPTQVLGAVRQLIGP